MADIFTPEKGSEVMASVKGRITTPDRFFRRLRLWMDFRSIGILASAIRPAPGTVDSCGVSLLFEF